ncbi:MAG: ATP-grasp domain-containing protein [Spirochaetales bacterium]
MKEFWVLYNAVPKETLQTKEGISEAAVEEEALAVYSHLTTLGYSPRLYPLDDITTLGKDLKNPPQLIFNLCEGYRGKAFREMHVAAFLELMEIPFTGNRAKTLLIAQDKDLTKRILSSHGLPTPSWAVFSGEKNFEEEALMLGIAERTDLGKILPVNQAGSKKIQFPVILKPSQEDSSLGIEKDSVVYSTDQLLQQAKKLYNQFQQPILVEEFLAGREFSLSLLQRGKELQILPVSELLFQQFEEEPPIVSYDAKWLPETLSFQRTPSICPASVAKELEDHLKHLALRTFQILGGKDYARVDIRLDAGGNPHVLEFNPNPDISPQAGFCKALQAGGITYSHFLSILIRNNLS